MYKRKDIRNWKKIDTSINQFIEVMNPFVLPLITAIFRYKAFKFMNRLDSLDYGAMILGVDLAAITSFKSSEQNEMLRHFSAIYPEYTKKDISFVISCYGVGIKKIKHRIGYKYNTSMVNYITRQLAAGLNTKEGRLNVLTFLCNIAAADGIIDRVELRYITAIASRLGIKKEDLDNLLSFYIKIKKEESDAKQQKSSNQNLFKILYNNKSAHYKTLGLPNNAPIEAVKSAFKKKALQTHPDRLIGKSEAEQKKAKEQFIEYKKAYEALTE